MVFHGLRLEYALEYGLNFISWRDMMEDVLEDNGLKKCFEQEIPKPLATDAQNLDEWKKCVVKA